MAIGLFDAGHRVSRKTTRRLRWQALQRATGRKNHAKIMELCAKGMPATEIASALEMHIKTVQRHIRRHGC